jgi:hypothetical protein
MVLWLQLMPAGWSGSPGLWMLGCTRLLLLEPVQAPLGQIVYFAGAPLPFFAENAKHWALLPQALAQAFDEGCWAALGPWKNAHGVLGCWC